MDEMRKANICNAHFRSESAAKDAQRLCDSEFVKTQLTDKEMENLRKCAIFMTRIAKRFSKLYNDEKAWEG